MNISKSNNSNSSANVVQSNSRDINGPRFQNKNLNSYRGAPSTGLRTGPPKPAVQVIQAKQKLGKAVGAAALPPTPLNTPSLKRETQTNQTAPWNGSAQGIDEGSPSLKGLSGPAKPAPWAKPGNAVEVEKSEEPKVELTTAKQTTRSWANADDSDDEDRQENPPETEWPDNFRDAIEELPPAKSEQYDGHEGEFAAGGQRYVPPYGRNNRPNNSSGNEDRRTFNRSNNDDHENFYDSRYISSSSNRSQQFGGNNRQVERIDRDFGGRNDNVRRDHRVHEESGYNGREGNFPDQRNQRSNYRVDEDRDGDNRVSSRFNYDQERPAFRGDRNERYERNEGGDGGYRVTRPPVSGYENRGAGDNRGYRNSDYSDTSRFPSNRYAPRDQGYSDQSQYQGKRFGGGFASRQVQGRDDEDSNYRDRSRTMSEDYQQKPGYSSGNKNQKETYDAPRPEDTVDLKDIETSRREAEYLEQRKSKPISSERLSDRRPESNYSKEESSRVPPHQDNAFRQTQGEGYDSRRSTGLSHQFLGNSRQTLEQNRYDNNSHNYASESSNYGANFSSSNNRGVAGTEDAKWGRSSNRTGALSSNFPKQVYGGVSDRDIIPDYNPARREATHDSNVAGAYRGQDAVKLSFPQHHTPTHEDQVYNSESYSPPHYSSNRGHELEYQSSRQNQTGWREEPPRVRDNQISQQPPQEINYETEISRSMQNVGINSVASREDDPRGNRPRQLYDPKSNQLIDSDESQKGKAKVAPVLKEARQVEKPENEKWQKILQKTDSEEQVPRTAVKDAVLVERPKSDVAVTKVDPKSEELDKTQKVKLDRQRERLNREPRTKGFLYRYTESGELERVMSKWELEQQELERKKGLNVDETEDSFSDRVTVLKKKSDSTDHQVNADSRPNHTSSINDFSQENKRQRDSNESRGLSAVNANTNVGVVGADNQGNTTGSNILGTLMQGSSLFDSWNRPNHNLTEDSRNNSDLTGPSRMTWLTGSQNSSNPAFAPGLSSLGSGLAGIISSSSNVSSSLFPNTQQDWSYNTILSNDTGNTSLNPVYSGNSLNDINRQSSFSPFSGIPINLQDSVIQSEKKDGQYSASGLRHSEDTSGATPDNRQFFQREWQRFAQANTFGAVGNKTTNTKSSRPSSVDSPVLEISNNSMPSSVVAANHAINNSATNNLPSSVSPVVATSKSLDSDGGRSRELNEIHHLPPSRKEEEREASRGGRGHSRETSHSGGRGDHSRRSQPTTSDGDRRATEGSSRASRGRDNQYPSNPSQRSPVSSSVPTTTSFHTRISTTAPPSSRTSSDNRHYRDHSENRSKYDSSERRRDEPSSSSYDDDHNKSSSNSREGYNNSQTNTRRSYGGGSNNNNVGSGYSSSSRSSNQYSGGGRGRGGYNNNNSSGRGGGGRGYSGPRAQSEVISHSKSNEAIESSNKNATNN